MASKSLQKQNSSVEETEELLDLLDKNMDRLKTLYEQYFLGIQKQAPAPLHAEVERKIRELMQVQLRNTAHRYRFATLQQKFGSYNSYWRRTLRQIEQGTYIRQLSKIGRNAVRTGEAIPEEILAAMPKRMREQVIRDRENALAQARRRGMVPTAEDVLELGSDGPAAVLPDGHQDAPMELDEDAFADAIAVIKESTDLRRQVKQQRGPHKLDEADADLDLNAFFASVESGEASAAGATALAPGGPAAAVRQRSVTRASVSPPPPAPAQPPAPDATATAPPTPPASPGPPASPAFLPARTSPGIQPMAKQAVARAFPTNGKQTSPPPLSSTAGPTPLGKQGFGGIPPIPPPRSSSTMPAVPPAPTPAPPSRPTPVGRSSQVMQAVTPPPSRPSQPMAAVTPPPSRPSQPMAAVTPTPTPAPSQPPSRVSRPIPVQVGRDTPPDGVPAMPPERPGRPMRKHSDTERSGPPEVATPRVTPPPGMTEGDVNALYAKYVKAKEMVGEAAGPGAYGKLLKTINAQAPKIMEQYKAKGVDFQIVVKDNQVIIRAKPKP